MLISAPAHNVPLVAASPMEAVFELTVPVSPSASFSGIEN